LRSRVTIVLDRRADITLEAFERVAWRGETVELGAAALAAMDRAHESFERMIAERLAADPAAQIYAITFGPGDAGPVDREHDTRPKTPWTGASFGQALPARVVRGIVLARLANFLEGHTAARGQVAAAVAALLQPGGRVPAVPLQGTGGAGEILPLGHLFYELGGLKLEPKESMALINGSPCAAALVADVALAARGRTALAESVFALSVEALLSPVEAYSADVEPLWDDPHETAALRSLRSLLHGHHEERMARQSPVSHRILGRVLGQNRRAQAEAERAAAVSLRAVTDNPVYIPPDAARPLGTVFSTGGYHNTQAPAAIDAVASQWAQLAQLAERHTDRLFQHPSTATLLYEAEFTYKQLHMVQDGWAEEAASLAQPTLLNTASWGQNDVPSQSFPAWRKADAIGRCLDSAVGILAVVAVHVLAARDIPVPPALSEVVLDVNRHVPPITEARLVGPELEALSRAFTGRVYPA
jgi:histidine ammonia-lyase